MLIYKLDQTTQYRVLMHLGVYLPYGVYTILADRLT